MRLTSSNYPKGTRVAGIIFSSKRDQIAVIERYNNGRHYFVFPGGGIEDSDKNNEHALTRELFEETGLKIRNEQLVYTLIINGHSKQLFYICEATNKELQMTGDEVEKNSENEQYIPIWIPTNEIVKLPLFPIEVRDWIVEDVVSKTFKVRQLSFNSKNEMKNL